jgi:hypothetical protein
MNIRATLAIATMIVTTATTASAVTVNTVKRINLNHNATSSPFFTQNSTGSVNLNPFTQSDATSTVTFTPAGTVQAGQVTSLTSNGSFSITGDATSTNNWTDGNGIPAGITLTFNTQFTMSVGAGSPAGSVLTNPGLTGTSLGNGIGITQTLGGNHTMDSSNLIQSPGSGTESLEVSAMTVSNIVFSGTLAEEDFTFTPGTVGNFGPYVLRSNGFTENGETLGLTSATATPDPENPTRPTIGFGTPSADPSEIGRGKGNIASHLFIDDGFADGSDDLPTPAPNWFPRQIGAYTLTPQNATIAVKGIGYEYDVTFDISPIGEGLDGDFNTDGSVDAADYVVWRKNPDGTYTEADYDMWLTNFGSTEVGAGSGAAVPEPATVSLVGIAILTLCIRRRTH